MFDSNWDLINGDDAHAIEVLNQSSVANLIEAILRFLIHHDTDPGPSCTLAPNQTAIKELHRIGTFLLLARPGEYRQEAVYVQKRDGSQYQPPGHDAVEAHMDQFALELTTAWLASSPVELASFVLWRMNWVHPFKNGNGRTARALAYNVVCLKVGFMLPGTTTLIDLITNERDQYEAALAHADQTYGDTGTGDLAPMQALVERLLIAQLSSMPPL
jgi:Fic family protein